MTTAPSLIDPAADLLTGVTAPIVTPMDADGHVLPATLAGLLGRFASSGVHAVLLAGSTGEGHALDVASLTSLVASVAPAWRARTSGRGRVLVNVSAPSTSEALRRAEAVAAVRPDAVVLSPPYYFIHTEAELIAHYAATSELGISVVAYNVPRYTGNPLTARVLQALSKMPWVVGVKDSSGDRDILACECTLSTARNRPFGVSQGDEGNLTAGLRMGANGIAPGLANLASARCVRLYDAAMAGDWIAADQAQQDLQRLAAIHGIRRGVVALKAALSLVGVCPPHASAPFLPCNDVELAALRTVLAGVATVLDEEVVAGNEAPAGESWPA